MGDEFKTIVTEDIVKGVVAKQFDVQPSDVTVTSYDIANLSSVGDNFMCAMNALNVQALVKGDEKVLTYAAKMRPLNEPTWMMLCQTGLMAAECTLYKDLAPKMQMLRKEAGMKPLSMPKAYYVSEHEGLIIMDNLKHQGFACLKKSAKGLGERDLNLALKGLAEYHATGYHFLQQHPGGEEKLLKDSPCLKSMTFCDLGDKLDNPECIDGPICGSMLSVAKLLRETAELPELAAKVEAKANATIFKKEIRSATQLEPDSFKTIVHGDAWCNNFMFRPGDDGASKDMRIVDFQMSNLNTPLLDLAYVFSSSTFPADRQDNAKRWLKSYHEALVKELAEFGYPSTIFPFEEALRVYKKFAYFGMTAEFVHIMALVTTSETAANSELDSNDANHKNENAIEEMARIGYTKIVQFAQSNPSFLQRAIDATKIAEANGLL